MEEYNKYPPPNFTPPTSPTPEVQHEAKPKKEFSLKQFISSVFSKKKEVEPESVIKKNKANLIKGASKTVQQTEQAVENISTNRLSPAQQTTSPSPPTVKQPISILVTASTKKTTPPKQVSFNEGPALESLPDLPDESFRGSVRRASQDVQLEGAKEAGTINVPRLKTGHVKLRQLIYKEIEAGKLLKFEYKNLIDNVLQELMEENPKSDITLAAIKERLLQKIQTDHAPEQVRFTEEQMRKMSKKLKKDESKFGKDYADYNQDELKKRIELFDKGDPSWAEGTITHFRLALDDFLSLYEKVSGMGPNKRMEAVINSWNRER